MGKCFRVTRGVIDMHKLNSVPVKSGAQGKPPYAAKTVYSNFYCHETITLVFKQNFRPVGEKNSD
jgi:hypothetical protein